MPLFKLIKSNSFDRISFSARTRKKQQTHTQKQCHQRISLFTYFLDLILIQSWRTEWKVNSIIWKPVISRQTLNRSITKRSNFNWFLKYTRKKNLDGRWFWRERETEKSHTNILNGLELKFFGQNSKIAFRMMIIRSSHIRISILCNSNIQLKKTCKFSMTIRKCEWSGDNYFGMMKHIFTFGPKTVRYAH